MSYRSETTGKVISDDVYWSLKAILLSYLDTDKIYELVELQTAVIKIMNDFVEVIEWVLLRKKKV